MSKEHDEAVQAYKDGKIDVGMTLTNGKWTICGVFKGKLSWIDLPIVKEHQVGCKGKDYGDCRSCEHYEGCYEEEEGHCDTCGRYYGEYNPDNDCPDCGEIEDSTEEE